MRSFESVAPDSVDAAIKAKKLIIFCGAGISMAPPTNAPSWWEIYSTLAAMLKDTLRESHIDLYNAVDIDELLSDLNTQEVANFVIGRFGGVRFGDLLRIVDTGEPNASHLAVATLFREKRLLGVVTTNFDTLIERAAQHIGVNVSIATPNHTASLEVPGNHIIKLHGTAVEPNLMLESSWSKFSPIDETLNAYLDKVLCGATVLVVGYSGSDISCSTTSHFFELAVKRARNVVWLCRHAETPSLPPFILDRTEFAFGELPDVLKALTKSSNIAKYPTRVSVENPKTLLFREAKKWSRHETAGPLAACVLFLSIAHRQRGNKQSEKLVSQLLSYAEALAEKYQPGNQLPPDGTTIANFLRFSALTCMERGALESAQKLLRTSLNILNAFYQYFSANSIPTAGDFLPMISAGYLNYGIACIGVGDKRGSESAFNNALTIAYQSNSTNEFLSALYNIYANLNYPKISIHDIHTLEQCLNLSINNNKVDLCYEFSMLMGVLLIDRNEIWSARSNFEKARNYAIALFDHLKVLMADMKLAECEIRQGNIEAGLNAFSNESIHRIFLGSKTLRTTGLFLSEMKIQDSSIDNIAIKRDSVPSEKNRIETELAAAQAETRMPFGGNPIAIHQSLVGRGEYGGILCTIGKYDLYGDQKSAIDRSMYLVLELSKRNFHYEAKLVLRNILCRDNLESQIRINAEVMLAKTYAHLSEVDQASELFNRNFDKVNLLTNEKALEFLIDGLWFNAQKNDLEITAKWAKAAVVLAKNDTELCGWIQRERSALIRAGKHFVTVAEVLKTENESTNYEVKGNDVIISTKNERRFSIHDHESEYFNRSEIERSLYEAEQLTTTGDFEKAKAVLEELEQRYDLTEFERAPLAALLFRCDVETLSPTEVEKEVWNLRNKYLVAREFSLLSCLELEYAIYLIRMGDSDTLVKEGPRAAIYEKLSLHARSAGVSKFIRWALEIPVDQYAIVEAAAGGYFGVASTFGNIYLQSRQSVERQSSKNQLNIMEEIRLFRDLVQSVTTIPDVVKHLVACLKTYRLNRVLTWELFGGLVDSVAMQALSNGAFSDALELYKRSLRLFERAGSVSGQRIATMGKCRALSLGGNHIEAIRLLTFAVQQVDDFGYKAELFNAIGSAYSRQSDSLEGEDRIRALSSALGGFEKAIQLRDKDLLAQSLSRMGKAKILWAMGENSESMRQVDIALAGLSHLSNPAAKFILEQRTQLEQGDWSKILV